MEMGETEGQSVILALWQGGLRPKPNASLLFVQMSFVPLLFVRSREQMRGPDKGCLERGQTCTNGKDAGVKLDTVRKKRVNDCHICSYWSLIIMQGCTSWVQPQHHFPRILDFTQHFPANWKTLIAAALRCLSVCIHYFGPDWNISNLVPSFYVYSVYSHFIILSWIIVVSKTNLIFFKSLSVHCFSSVVEFGLFILDLILSRCSVVRSGGLIMINI